MSTRIYGLCLLCAVVVGIGLTSLLVIVRAQYEMPRYHSPLPVHVAIDADLVEARRKIERLERYYSAALRDLKLAKTQIAAFETTCGPMVVK